MDLRMTADERVGFLSETPRVGVLSVDASGRAPVSSPVWYTFEPDGSISFSVGTGSQKARLLRAAGRATICVQSETPPYSYVSVEGARRDYGVVLTGSLDDLTLAIDTAATERLRSEKRSTPQQA